MWTNCLPVPDTMGFVPHVQNIPDFSPPASFSGGMPATQRELCAGCCRLIDDRFLMRVVDLSWHEHCLQCSVCRAPLQGSCFVKDQKLFCRHDYDKIFRPKCSACMQQICPPNQLVMRAHDHVFHVHCFRCMACGQPLQKGDEFAVRHGQILCRIDFEKEMAFSAYSPKCDDSDSYDDDSDSGKPPKRPRTILTTSQRRKFKSAFEMNPKPCRKVRESLAAETGLSVRVVQVWFQNQRAKVKKIARRQNQDGGKGKKEGSGGDGADKVKVKSPTDKKDADDSESDSSFIGQSETNGVTTKGEARLFGDQMGNFDTDHSDSAYSSTNTGSHAYSNGSMLDDKMDSIDQLLGQDGRTMSGSNTLINPIDKLYSMQSSYFNAE